MTRTTLPGAALLVLLATAPALAQNPQTTAPQNPTAPVAPPSSSTTPPERIAPADGGNLSQKLSNSHGAITPPAVDPGMAIAPPRGAATTPVIPPPGSPGGNQSVVPK